MIYKMAIGNGALGNILVEIACIIDSFLVS